MPVQKYKHVYKGYEALSRGEEKKNILISSIPRYLVKKYSFQGNYFNVC